MGLKSIPMPFKGDFTMKSHQRVLRGRTESPKSPHSNPHGGGNGSKLRIFE